MNLPKFKDYVDQPVRYIQRKMDGHMYHIIKDSDGVVTCTTKNGKDKTDKMMAIDRIRKQIGKLPHNTHLMVELHIPGEPATEVARGIAHADQRLEIAVFAVPVLDGIDLSDIDLLTVELEVASYGLKFVDVHEYHGVTMSMSKTEVDSLLKEAVELGIEGWVLKESHMSGWYKLKPVKTIDAFVISVTESDSETYLGHMKAVRLGLNLKASNGIILSSYHDLGECGGGFTKEFKLSRPYVEMSELLKGRVCEVAYQSVTTHKKLQFPRFIRWRTDKDAGQCTTEQLK